MDSKTVFFFFERHDIQPIEDVVFLQSYSWLFKTEDTTIKLSRIDFKNDTIFINSL